jgi:hypothetical protein
MNGAELAAGRTAAAAVLADYRAALASAPLSRPPGREWMFRLADALGKLLDGLDAVGAEDRTVLLSALEDASACLRERAAWCPACQSHPADLCDETADQLARADEYDRLAAALREVAR